MSSIDRRRHRGPFRILYMDLKSFMRRYLHLG
jgi:hypothetical protein